MARALMSPAPPGGAGTTSLIGRLGKSAALAGAAASAAAAKTGAIRRASVKQRKPDMNASPGRIWAGEVSGKRAAAGLAAGEVLIL
ncbi:Uncharacterised protein [Bordetella pertussis]|nr:Uncharacterised protein [Bordetella pertussis]CFO01887.1 Uncharacterised protein [Bordetella pertussis]CPK40718.1 Uncharacterised protein [Bordetella pertussis]